jgi:carbon storage regulator
VLILTRKVGEEIRIGADIVIVVRLIKGDRVRVGIEAPKSIRLLRGELQGGPPSPGSIAHSVCNL